MKAQSTTCDTIFSNPTISAIFMNGDIDLRNYFVDELVPIISDCVKAGVEPLSKFTVCFTIDHTGKVVGISFPMTELSSTYHRALSAKLGTMTGWKPASKNGFAVCSFFNFTISCLNWTE